MLDRDLAEMYGVETKVLNQAVKRALTRFSDDFMFQLTREAVEFSRLQFVTLNVSRGKNFKYLPYVFTGQGVAMLSSVLRSETAIQINIQEIRVITTLKQLLIDTKDLLLRMEKIEHALLQKDEEVKAILRY